MLHPRNQTVFHAGTTTPLGNNICLEKWTQEKKQIPSKIINEVGFIKMF